MDREKISPNVGKILYVANTSWYLYNFRRSLMEKMIELGYRVSAAAPRDDYSRKLEQVGIHYINLSMSRNSKNPFVDLMLLLRLLNLYTRNKFDLIHHFTPKIVIYGSFAARVAGLKSVVNSVTGLGHTFAKNGLLKHIVSKMYKVAFSGSSHIIFQNIDNQKMFLRNKIVLRKATHLVKGSGVNTDHFSPGMNKTQLDNNVRFSLIARLIWDKGVREFVEAAKIVKGRCPLAHFALIGNPDEGNPNAVSQRYLAKLKDVEAIRWTGHTDDVKTAIQNSDVIVLPSSYGEGVPRTLIEGASMAKPLVTTNVPGCREIVDHNINGLLIPPNDVNALIDAMLKLANNPEMRYQMGQNGRKKVLEEFDEKIVIQKTLEIYKKAGLQLVWK